MLQLEIKADTHLKRLFVPAQELIVVTATATDTMTLGVEHHALHQNLVNLACICLALWLRHPHTPPMEHLLALITAHLHVMTMGNRQQDGL